ncbi:MAG TPA: hypothetical protein VHV08_14520, partial [Pirellulales bacterium]|nr:hypothetical protein [Pirellulales bacterium]
MRSILIALVLVLMPAAAWAQFNTQPEQNGPRLDRQSTVRIRLGVIVRAAGGAVFNSVATVPVPSEWPEQQVAIAKEDLSSSVHGVTYRNLGQGGARQMVVEIPLIPAGGEAKALITFELTRRVLAAPSDPSIYKIPKKLDRKLTNYIGSSTFIESRHP